MTSKLIIEQMREQADHYNGEACDARASAANYRDKAANKEAEAVRCDGMAEGYRAAIELLEAGPATARVEEVPGINIDNEITSGDALGAKRPLVGQFGKSFGAAVWQIHSDSLASLAISYVDYCEKLGLGASEVSNCTVICPNTETTVAVIGYNGRVFAI